jgi:hypothetical protein
MGNIFKLLDDNKIHIGLRRYTYDDWATGIEITKLLENNSIIINYYNSINDYSITSLENYIDYIFLYKLVEYDTYVEIVKDEMKQEFSNIITTFNGILNNYKRKDIFSFINDNIQIICEYEDDVTHHDIDIKIETVTYCLKYRSGIDKDTWKCLISHCSHLLIDSFDRFINVVKENNDLADLFFSNDTLNKLVTFRLEDIFDILVSLQNQAWFSNKFEEIVTFLINYIEEQTKDLKVEDAIISQSYVVKLFRFLDTIKHSKAKEWQFKLDEQNNLLDDYLQNHGQSFSYEINIKSYVDMIEKSDIGTKAAKMLVYLTNYSDGKTFTHFFDQLVRDSKPSITDFVSIANVKTNKLFTPSIQTTLGIELQHHMLKVNYILNNDELTNMLFSEVTRRLTKVFNYHTVNFVENEIIENNEMLFNLILLYVSIIKSDKEQKLSIQLSAIAYSIEMLTCGLIEKSLRLIYKSKVDENGYINENSISLGVLLNKDNSIINDIIGINHIKLLRFYLINDDNEVGEGIRNNLAHFKNLKMKDFNYGNVEKLLVLYFGLITAIAIQNENKNG